MAAGKSKGPSADSKGQATETEPRDASGEQQQQQRRQSFDWISWALPAVLCLLIALLAASPAVNKDTASVAETAAAPSATAAEPEPTGEPPAAVPAPVPAGQARQAYIARVRDELLRYVRNPGSKITVKGSREQAAAQVEGLSESRALEEYAKVLCVQGRGSEAATALSTQLQLAQGAAGGAGAPSDPSAALVTIRLTQAFFTQGRFASVRKLLGGILQPEALGAAPQWWGHLQWRLALAWSDDPADQADAAVVLISVCLELRTRLRADFGSDPGPCAGPAAVGQVSLPGPTVSAFRGRGYGLWPGLLPEASLLHLRRHYAELLARDAPDGVGNDRRQRRHGWHNEPVAGYFHYLVAEAVREMDPELVPTYVFSVVYLEGGELFPHLDRPDNEVSLTMSLGSDPPGYAWPLAMDGEELLLEPGDAVLYRGAETRHARGRLPPGYRSWHVIFAFRRQCAECCHLV